MHIKRKKLIINTKKEEENLQNPHKYVPLHRNSKKDGM